MKKQKKANKPIKRIDIPTTEQLLNGFWMQYLAIRDLAGDAVVCEALNSMVEDFNNTMYSQEEERH